MTADRHHDDDSMMGTFLSGHGLNLPQLGHKLRAVKVLEQPPHPRSGLGS